MEDDWLKVLLALKDLVSQQQAQIESLRKKDHVLCSALFTLISHLQDQGDAVFAARSAALAAHKGERLADDHVRSLLQSIGLGYPDQP